MTGIYKGRDAVWSWAAGTEGSPVSEAGYPVFDDFTLDPEIRDTVNNFTAGTIYQLAPQIVGKKMAASLRMPMFQQATIATVPPVYGKFLRMAGMSETDSGSTFVYTAADVNFATDDVAGSCYPGDIKFNIDNHLLPLFTSAVAEVAFELVAPGLPTLAVNLLGQRALAYPIDTTQVTMATPTYPVPIGSTSITLTRVAPVVTGAATAIGTTTLTDSAATFLTSGVQPGDVITNTTDGSTGGGVVTSVTGETTVVHTALTGGAGNDWVNADAYTIAAGAAPVEVVRRVYLPLGNVLTERPGVGGINAYYSPRITERSNAIYSIDLDMPVRTDYDWQRCIDTMGREPTASYFTVAITHNSGGAAGSVLAWTFRARPFGKVSISRGSGGQLGVGLQLMQDYSGTKLTLTVS